MSHSKRSRKGGLSCPTLPTPWRPVVFLPYSPANAMAPPLVEKKPTKLAGISDCFCAHSTNATPSVFQSFVARPCGSLIRSEEHTSELQSLRHLVCRLLL